MSDNTYDKYIKAGAIHHKWYRKGVVWYKESVDLLVDFAMGSCVDLGCGDGLVSKLISEKGHDVLGIDNSEEGMRIALELSPKAEYLIADIDKEEINLEKKYKYMVCLNTIEHLYYPENVARFFRDNIENAGMIITDRKVEGRRLKGSHIREFSIDELRDIFKEFDTKEIQLKTGAFIALEIKHP